MRTWDHRRFSTISTHHPTSTRGRWLAGVFGAHGGIRCLPFARRAVEICTTHKPSFLHMSIIALVHFLLPTLTTFLNQLHLDQRKLIRCSFCHLDEPPPCHCARASFHIQLAPFHPFGYARPAYVTCEHLSNTNVPVKVHHRRNPTLRY